MPGMPPVFLATEARATDLWSGFLDWPGSAFMAMGNDPGRLGQPGSTLRDSCATLSSAAPFVAVQRSMNSTPVRPGENAR